MLGFLPSLCFILIIFFKKLLLISAVRYYYYEKPETYEINSLDSIYEKCRIHLIIDLESTTFVDKVILKFKRINTKIPDVYAYSRDLKIRSCSKSDVRDSTHATCNIFTRILKLNGYACYSSINLTTKELMIDNFIGCFTIDKVYEITPYNVNLSIECSKKCVTQFFGLNEEGCRCFINLNITSQNISQCKPARNSASYEPLGHSGYFAIYTRKLRQVSMKFNLSDWMCVSDNEDCKSKKPGRTGFYSEIIDCSSNNGLCGELNCESLEVNPNVSASVCSCRQGFGFDNRAICQDIDECLTKTFTCQDNILQICNNTIGSYTCDCVTGYVKGTLEPCVDLDECSLNLHSCNTTFSMCSNKVGGFDCECVPGFMISDPPNFCEDIDECKEINFDKCPDEIMNTCKNTFGSFVCDCSPGYMRDNTQTTCTDLDECELDWCDKDSTICTNTVGSYLCPCSPGFVPLPHSNTKCDDIDECMGQNQCDVDSTICANVPGSFFCDCQPGFAFKYASRLKCQDIDECTTMQHHCSRMSTCVNTIGSFECTCPEGTVKQSHRHIIDCQDIDECLTLNDCNLTISLCLNTPFGYKCLCLGSYVNVDNYTCMLGIGQISASPFFMDYTDHMTTTESTLSITELFENYLAGILIIGSLLVLFLMVGIARCILFCSFYRQSSLMSSADSGISGIISTI